VSLSRRLAGDELKGELEMLQRLREKRQDEGGFTLIELLVVILIIAILAAIAIPVFLRQREKGWVSQSQSALKNAATAEESYLTGNGAYTGTIADLETDEGLKYASDVSLTATFTTGQDYCIVATHAALPAAHDWKVSSYDSDEGKPALDDAC
jgi:type IV pilus assembly protein PilA